MSTIQHINKSNSQATQLIVTVPLKSVEKGIKNNKTTN